MMNFLHGMGIGLLVLISLTGVVGAVLAAVSQVEKILSTRRKKLSMGN